MKPTPKAPVAATTVAPSRTILLVEDEESVRSLVRKLLIASGLTVLDAPEWVPEFLTQSGRVRRVCDNSDDDLDGK